MGGNIHHCGGGIHLAAVGSCNITDIDTELSAYGHLPSLYVQGNFPGAAPYGAYGLTLTDVTLSTRSNATPSGIAVIDTSYGVTITGGLNVLLDYVANPVDNIKVTGFGGGLNIIGGYYGGVPGNAGYFCQVATSTRLNFQNPHLNVLSYMAGHAQILQTGGAANQVVSQSVMTSEFSAPDTIFGHFKADAFAAKVIDFVAPAEAANSKIIRLKKITNLLKLLTVFDADLSDGDEFIRFVQNGIFAQAIEILSGNQMNLGLFGNSYGNGINVINVDNAITIPNANPTTGTILYVEGGALKARGSGGTVTTIAPA